MMPSRSFFGVSLPSSINFIAAGFKYFHLTPPAASFTLLPRLVAVDNGELYAIILSHSSSYAASTSVAVASTSTLTSVIPNIFVVRRISSRSFLVYGKFSRPALVL